MTEFRSFVDRVVRPNAEDFDRAGEIPAWVLEEVSAAGYWGAVLDGDMVRFGALHEEIGRGCSSLRSLLTVHSMVSYAVDRWGTAAAREKWLPQLASGRVLGGFCLTEAEAGSDCAALVATAVPHEGGYRINARKKWTTGGQIAGLLLVFARTERGLSAFVVPGDAPGVKRTPIGDVLGTRASMMADIELVDCEVGADSLVGAEGMGLAVITGALDIGRYSVACGSVGITQACLEAVTAHCTERVQGGSVLAEHQLVQKMITEMAVNVRAARLLCVEAGESKDRGDPETIIATCVAKYFASTTAMRAAGDAVQLHGAVGCADGHPVSRYFRDAKVMEIIEGSTQIQELLIARDALRGR
ncbi:acyl-CoA dehydrogenase family protein [Allokutzneria sp. A3M-2-11 16]|uniref:acyl-CoA dehydrogenase family protein n=1 Tax=Allokutzneria sp. A3M-2-11 16 TaxID=2962043 RepID=UPI0020B66187|nr:acyl-CoA dehydrogenase family protein [Allokutzneria sp. A3M-2-11 16]MCP3805309.1 acyl-CoA dehydrogenase family protein [Allokutzneria sp. A3M-2-11 16]